MSEGKKHTPFSLALAARRGEVQPETLHGAARKLYRDRTVSEDQLSNYAGYDRSNESQGKFPAPRATIRARRS